MITLFRPISEQRLERDRTYFFVCFGSYTDPVVLESFPTQKRAVQETFWWRRRGLDARPVEVTVEPTLVDRMKQAATPDEARRILDLENRRYFSGFSGCEVE